MRRKKDYRVLSLEKFAGSLQLLPTAGHVLPAISVGWLPQVMRGSGGVRAESGVGVGMRG